MRIAAAASLHHQTKLIIFKIAKKMKKFIRSRFRSILSNVKNLFRGELVEVTFAPGTNMYTYVKITE